MVAKKLLTGFAAASLVMIGAAGAVRAQQAMAIAPGTVYALHTSAAGACPALDWHIVAGEGGTLSGMISWNNMSSMAHATGKIGADRMVSMKATEVGGAHRTAEITGKARPDGWLVVDIKGPKVECTGITIPTWRQQGTQQ